MTNLTSKILRSVILKNRLLVLSAGYLGVLGERVTKGLATRLCTLFHIFFLLFFFGCSGSHSVDNLNKSHLPNDVLRIGVSGTFLMESPLIVQSGYTSLVNSLVYEGLVRVGDSGKFVNNLAEKVTVQLLKDKSRITKITVRPSVFFHNGKSLTANDVVATLRCVKTKKLFQSVAPYFDQIEKIQATTSNELFLQTYPGKEFYQTILTVPILPFNKTPCFTPTARKFAPVPGTGPYKVVVWKENLIQLEAFIDYWKQSQAIHKVHFQTFPNSHAAWATLVRSELDLLSFINFDLKQITVVQPHLNIFQYAMPFFHAILFIKNDSFIKKVSFRKALNYAIDRGQIIGKVLNGKGRPCSTIFLDDNFDFKNNFSYSYDPNRAIEILEDDGFVFSELEKSLKWQNTNIRLTLAVLKGNQESEMLAQFLKKYLLDIGIILLIQYVDPDKVDTLVSNKGADLIYFFSRAVNTADDLARYFLPEGDSIFQFPTKNLRTCLAAIFESKSEFENDIKTCVNREMFLNPPGIFLFRKDVITAVHKRVRNVNFCPWNYFCSITSWEIDYDWKQL